MKQFKKILAVANQPYEHDQIIPKALMLATKAHAHLTLFSNDEHKSSLEHYINQEKLQRLLSTQIASNSDQHLDDFYQCVIDIKTSTNGCSHQDILQELANEEYDLLIKSQTPCHQYMGLSLTVNGHLLRKSPTNLLFVGKQKWPEHGRILTALETEEPTQQHQSLNTSLLDETRYVAHLLASDIHLLNCYQEDNSMSLAQVDQQTIDHQNGQGQEQVQDLYHQHVEHLSHSAKAYQVKSEYLHVEQGLPDYVIPHEAQKHSASIVVLGAGEHHGFVEALKGHTAEYIIDQLDCDTLILKANAEQIH
jgi:nucleotide-binding universal stress UspA family protein